MKRNIIMLVILALLTFSFWGQVNLIYRQKPEKIRDLDYEIQQLNERLISAQILARKLDRVYRLFEENLALSQQDSLAEDASLPFLKTLTEMLDDLKIKLLHIQPRPRITFRDYVITPYDVEIQCNFKKFGKLMAELEKSHRMIVVEEFLVKNGLERLKSAERLENLDKQNIVMKISTMTLIKHRIAAM